MNYTGFILLLTTVTATSLLWYLLSHVFDYLAVTSKQKLILFKTGLITLTLIPCLSLALLGVGVIIKSNPVSRFTFFTHYHISTASPLNPLLYSCAQMNLPALFLSVYGFAVFIILMRILVCYLSLRKQLATSLPTILQGQQVWLNSAIQSPFSFGVPNARIYFPANAKTQWSAREIAICLAHEKTHVTQHDSLWKLLSLCMRAILFFAPWVYTVHQKFTLETEIYCDTVTRHKTQATSKEYGELLLAMFSAKNNTGPATHLSYSTLKRRFIAMQAKSVQRPLLLSLACTLLLCTGTLAIAASTSSMLKTTVYTITSEILLDGQIISRPKIICKDNQPAEISLQNQDGTQSINIKLVAHSTQPNVLQINYDINFKNGTDQQHSKPDIMVIGGQEAVIHLASKSGHDYMLRARVERD